jgi:hypothetical protein
VAKRLPRLIDMVILLATHWKALWCGDRGWLKKLVLTIVLTVGDGMHLGQKVLERTTRVSNDANWS